MVILAFLGVVIEMSSVNFFNSSDSSFAVPRPLTNDPRIPDSGPCPWVAALWGARVLRCLANSSVLDFSLVLVCCVLDVWIVILDGLMWEYSKFDFTKLVLRTFWIGFFFSICCVVSYSSIGQRLRAVSGNTYFFSCVTLTLVSWELLRFFIFQNFLLNHSFIDGPNTASTIWTYSHSCFGVLTVNVFSWHLDLMDVIFSGFQIIFFLECHIFSPHCHIFLAGILKS